MYLFTNTTKSELRHSLCAVMMAIGLILLPHNLKAQEENASISEIEDEGNFFMALGAATHLPKTDYVNWGLGLDLTMGATLNRHLIALDLDICSMGDCRKDIHAHKGTIFAGEHVTSAGIYFIYGKKVRHYGILEMTPYMGLGARSYYGGCVDDKYFDEDNEDNDVYKTGFSAGIGLMLDIDVLHRLHLDPSKGTHRLRIKPFVNVTPYHNQPKIVPAFNLTIQWCYAL